MNGYAADLGIKIRQVLIDHPEGLSAKDIAQKIRLRRKAVNRYLYAHPEEFVSDASYKPIWTVNNAVTETNSVLRKLQNREGAKTFTLEDFSNIADWNYGRSVASRCRYKYKTASGNIIECDSEGELILLKYLDDKGLVVDMGGQNLQISYNSAFRTGCKYYPDIIVLTRDHHIAVFEVKSLTAMDYHRNIEKYRSLVKYCEEQGYMYVMVDPKAGFTSYEEIRDMNVSSTLIEMIREWMEVQPDSAMPYRFFDKKDVKKWYKIYGKGFTKKSFYIQVHSIIIKNGFKVYSRPVKLNRNHEVVDYV